MSAAAERKLIQRTLAMTVAMEMIEKLKPFVLPTPEGFGWRHPHLLAIGGSLRRLNLTVKDIELVFVPRTETRMVDLISNGIVDLAHLELERLAECGALEKRLAATGHIAGWGPKNKLAVDTSTGIPVDFFSTTPENWWTTLVIRTGSRETNLKLTTGAHKFGRKLNAYGEGITESDGNVIRATSEQHVFELCGVPYLEPKDR